MTWTRLDDSWTDKPQLEHIDYAGRWHYLAMIQFCCRNDRHDGLIRASDARRASDHPDPARALSELAAVGLIEVVGAGYRIVEIADHVPPPWVAKKQERDRERKRRERAHKAGDHSLCDADHCPVAANVATTVTTNVAANAGTGRDGTGRADIATGSENVMDWPTVVPGKSGEAA
ncbi:hypothetical protein [Microbacterium sp. SORGH_AS_0888]|uniref:hypothetical protein n=1 Tax=Microbacterium sp. SORGH_AS_0888 TaxID=3041791 RepID=UPI0027882249|nr:hypothetical protein [Microbacterium sp. SORGH_AS_0888]MDQ1130242.1 hypothetical protein [Microbacterium sp. SORGH_AS_0888]